MIDAQLCTCGLSQTAVEPDYYRLGWRASRVFCAFFFLVVAVMFFSGCRSGLPDRVTDLPLRQASAEELVTMLNQRSEQIHSLRALVQLQARGKLIPIRSTMNMSLTYVKPSFIRLRAFDPLGRTLFDLASNHIQFRVHFPMQNRVVTGIHSATSIDSPLETSSMREQLLYLVMAVSKTILATSIDDRHHVTLHEEGLFYRIAIMETPHASYPIRELWVERINLDVVKDTVLNATGDPIITVKFSDYRVLGAHGKILYPFHMSIHDMRTDSHYTLKFQEVIPNPDVEPGEFDVSGMVKQNTIVVRDSCMVFC